MNNVLMICPNSKKLKLLEQERNDKELHNIKFMTKEEFIGNYFFKTNEKTLEYLLKKYNFNLDVARVYLNNLYVIDTKKEYSSPKLNFLKKLKIELQENNLLEENPNFKNYVKNKNIVVSNYYDLDKYEEEVLNYKVEVPETILNVPVVECTTLEEEVNDVALKILDLIKKGISLNNIFLVNISNEYYYTLNKIFSYYKIPIEINYNKRNAIYLAISSAFMIVIIYMDIVVLIMIVFYIYLRGILSLEMLRRMIYLLVLIE